MAGVLLKRLPLLASLLALVACGRIQDEVALSQRVVRLRAAAEGESAVAPERVAPSKQAAARVRPLLREAVDGALKRGTAKLKLPAIPAVFRWDLVGKLTSWAVNTYQKPKSEAQLELLDGIIDLAAEVLGDADVATMEDSEFNARLGNTTRLQGLVERYAEQAGAPPAAKKLLDATADALKSKGQLDPSQAGQLVVDVVSQTSGTAVADLLSYMQKVAEGKEKLDAKGSAHFMDLHVPILEQVGAPKAAVDYLKATADMERRGVARDNTQEQVRGQRMLAESARQLGMPSAIPETFDFLAETIAGASATHLFEKPAERNAMIARLGELQAKLNDQLGGPAALSQLTLRLCAPLLNKTAPESQEVMGLLAEASKQLAFPSAVTEMLEYLGATPTPEPEKLQDMLTRLSEEVGAPPELAKFGKDVAAMSRKNGGVLEPAKLSKLVTQLFRKLHLPAFAELFSKLAAPMLIKGKKPDAVALAAAAPSLMKAMNDAEAMSGIVNDMRAKLMKPLTAAYETAVQKLTGDMPESGVKTAFKQVLSLARPA